MLSFWSSDMREDEINCDITGMVNDCSCQVMPSLLFIKRCPTHMLHITLDTEALVYTSCLFCFRNGGMLPKITDRGGIMLPLFGSV